MHSAEKRQKPNAGAAQGSAVCGPNDGKTQRRRGYKVFHNQCLVFPHRAKPPNGLNFLSLLFTDASLQRLSEVVYLVTCWTCLPVKVS
jgi:hypothetical protein